MSSDYLKFPLSTIVILFTGLPPNTLHNSHADTAILAGSTGLPASSVFLYEPFGQTAVSVTFGTNSDPTNATDQPMGWAASPTRKVAGAFTIPIIQMGARVYLPTAARFLQLDPIEGGTANGYVYAGDPINQSDYSGKCILCFAISLATTLARVVSAIAPKTTVAITTRLRPIVNMFMPTKQATLGAPVTSTYASNVFERMAPLPPKLAQQVQGLSGLNKMKGSMQPVQAWAKNFHWAFAAGGIEGGSALGGLFGFGLCAAGMLITAGGAAPACPELISLGSFAGGGAGFFLAGSGAPGNEYLDGVTDETGSLDSIRRR